MKTFNEIYESGFEEIKHPTKVRVKFDKDEVTFEFPEISEKPMKSFSFHLFLKPKKITLKRKDIIEVQFDKETYRSAGKTATGAIVGSALAGGFGLIAGAAIGGKERTRGIFQVVIKHKEKKHVVCLQPSKHSLELSYAFENFINNVEV